MPVEVNVAAAAADPEVTVVAVAGQIDLYTAPHLRHTLDGLIAQGHTRLVVDLREVDFIDSTGLGVLVARHRLLRHQDGWMHLVATSERVLRVVAITGLDTVFVVGDSVEAALHAHAAGTDA